MSSILIDVPHDSIVHQRYKRINYYYDLVSGKVTEAIYEPDSIDQFIHVYQYDADNRITDVLTSRDSLYWENDASYEYYDHGPLAREVIGQRQVQGIDYAYTLNGWVKGVNSSILNPSYDMGGDGDNYPSRHYPNATIGRDAYGYLLNYFTGDYRSIARTFFAAPGLPITSLYNGNISGTTYSMQTLSPQTVGYIYNYDQINRYVGDSLFKNPGTDTWNTRTGINDLKEKISYDENGNILSYLRHGNTAVGPLAMDSLTYHYNTNTNQLREVNDAVPATNYTVDIDNETSKHNYRYNGIGELASDSMAGIDSIYWTVFGKVKKIVKTNNDSIVFMYDPLGNRLEQRTFPHSGMADTIKYIRDAKGNIMALYDRKKDTVRLSEFDIYGVGRIGSLDTVLRMQKFITGHGTLDSLTISYLERQKQYALDNYLGNVSVTVSDGKTPVDTDIHTHDTAYYYLPIVINAQDYYPFGMIEPGRVYNLLGDSTYHFGFNGKWHDDNIYGKDNSYDYGMRFYDPRLARFMSIDPLEKKFAWNSPFSYAEDRPIDGSDLDGAEWDNIVSRFKSPENLKVTTLDDGWGNVQRQFYSVNAYPDNATKTFDNFKTQFLKDPSVYLNNTKADFKFIKKSDNNTISKGDIIGIKIHGGAFTNSLVKISNIESDKDNFSVTFNTLQGHIETGQITFSGHIDEKTNKVTFTISSTTRLNNLSVSAFSGTARENQQDSWVQVLNTVAGALGQKNGVMEVHIQTFEYNKGKIGKLLSDKSYEAATKYTK